MWPELFAELAEYTFERTALRREHLAALGRTAFARAVVLRPEVLLVDEPTAGLDPFSTRAVSSELLLARDAFGATVLAITHDLATAFHVADRMALLHEGRLVGDLPPAQFAHLPHPAVQRFLRTWRVQHPG